VSAHVSGPDQRLSIPRRVNVTGRRLDEDEWETLLAVADALVPGSETDPTCSGAPDYGSWLRRALAARAEHFTVVVEAVASLSEVRGDDLRAALKAMSERQEDAFAVLSSVVVGAYVMVPEVRGLIGYPGQSRHPIGVEEAFEQLEDGILDRVIDRGQIYVSTDSD
jgi:hypothetical protein